MISPIPPCRFAVLALFFGLSGVARAGDVLWQLDFSNDPVGGTIEAAPYVHGAAVAQKVVTDEVNTLLVESALGPLLKKPLVYRKRGREAYSPRLELLAPGEGVSSGQVRISWELAIEDVMFDGTKDDGTASSIETLMNFEVLPASGPSQLRLTVLGRRDGELQLQAGTFQSGTTSSAGPYFFKAGDVMSVIMNLDFDKHTASVTVKGEVLGESAADETKVASFRGLKISDGTAVGGNWGTTFTAGIDNIVVTRE
jgi:hypothetical protein